MPGSQKFFQSFFRSLGSTGYAGHTHAQSLGDLGKGAAFKIVGTDDVLLIGGELPKPLEERDFHTDSYGLELNRQTITGEWDDLFKSLIEMFEKKHINDDDYFQKYLKAHLDRGARMIYSEFKYSGDFVMALLKKDTTI